MDGYDFSVHENGQALKTLNDVVLRDPDSYTSWEALVGEVEQLKGGLNRNSPPESISLFRAIYDRFLAKFPLFFGFWKMYAQHEFTIAGTEASEMVYERGLACVSMSADLWIAYCAFKMETCHDADSTREVFERGLAFIGLDFQAYGLWEKYLEFEERNDDPARVFKILERAIQVPSSAYQRFFVSYQQALQTVTLSEIATEQLLNQLRGEIQHENSHPLSEYELDRQLRDKLGTLARLTYTRTETETVKRDSFERAIRRSYFHVLELSEDELVNWRKYLDFEEAEGDKQRIVTLYERCLVACALYDEFWLRYVQWIQLQESKEEEVRNIYLRASCVFVPISRPHIRLQYAIFEESTGRKDVADAVYEAILSSLPKHIDTIIAWARFRRRYKGPESAIELLETMIADDTNDVHVKGAIVAEIARLTWKAKGDVDGARAVFQKNTEAYVDVLQFWIRYFAFETDMFAVVAVRSEAEPEAVSEQIERVHQLVENVQKNSRIPQPVVREIARQHQHFLLENSPVPVGKDFLDLDRQANGLLSAQAIAKAKTRPETSGPVSSTPMPSSASGMTGMLKPALSTDPSTGGDGHSSSHMAVDVAEDETAVRPGGSQSAREYHQQQASPVPAGLVHAAANGGVHGSHQHQHQQHRHFVPAPSTHVPATAAYPPNTY